MPLAVVERDIACPFCGESITVLLDLSAGDQAYIEDCQVCCRPIAISYVVDESDAVEIQVDCAS
jgi:transcription elongation factor Elf1